MDDSGCRVFKGGKHKANRARCQNRAKKESRKIASLPDTGELYMERRGITLSKKEHAEVQQLLSLHINSAHYGTARGKRYTKLIKRLLGNHCISENIYAYLWSWQKHTWNHYIGFRTQYMDLVYLSGKLDERSTLIEKLEKYTKGMIR